MAKVARRFIYFGHPLAEVDLAITLLPKAI